jgi:hypothetical protein
MSHDDDQHQTTAETEGLIEDAEGPRTEARRKFLKTAGQVAVTSPAVTLLLSAGMKRATAGVIIHYMEPIIDPMDTGQDTGVVDTGTDPGDSQDPT